ncbi:MAG: ferritin family protein [Candidatus Zixiibacteriota bacterium]
MPDRDLIHELLEPLRTALQMETEGRQLFLEAARRASGRHARQTFEFLAAEEERHIERIREFYASIEDKGSAAAAEIPPSDPGKRLLEFNDQLANLRDEIKPTLSDIEAFRFAIRFENGAEEFYRKQIETTPSDKARDFYRWLVGEEEIHAQVLGSCLEFAEDPAAWFRRHGRSK